MNIIEQQIELHFGDEFPSVDKQARRYCQSLLGRPWWGPNSGVMISNEGGKQGMWISALASIIEHKDDVETGLKAYGLRLRAEYGSDKLQDLPLNVEIEVPLTKVRERDADLSRSHTLDGLGDTILPLSGIELDFFTTFASIKDIQETSSLLGISYNEGRKVYQRVTMRGKRRLQER